MNDTKQKVFDLFRSQNKRKITKNLSFSQFRNWSICPHLHFLISIGKKIPYPDNDYTAYGYPLHETLEKMMLEYATGLFSNSTEENYQYFLRKYKENITSIIEKNTDEELTHNNVIKFALAAKEHIKNVYSFLETKFGNFVVISVEEEFAEMIDIETEHYVFKFRGMMDLVLQTEDGKIHIVDWKTSSNGWSEYRKNKTLYLDQLLFYTHFYSTIHNVPLSDIESHFIILESTSHEIDVLDLPSPTKKDVQDLFNKVSKMVITAFETRRFLKTGMCGNFCDCKTYYSQLPTNQ